MRYIHDQVVPFGVSVFKTNRSRIAGSHKPVM